VSVSGYTIREKTANRLEYESREKPLVPLHNDFDRLCGAWLSNPMLVGSGPLGWTALGG
jgi:hypothetical protein